MITYYFSDHQYVFWWLKCYKNNSSILSSSSVRITFWKKYIEPVYHISYVENNGKSHLIGEEKHINWFLMRENLLE